MKKLRIPAALATIILCGIYMLYGAPGRVSRPHKTFGAPGALGAEDDADARYHYEWQQLHDPATGKIPDHVRARELAYAATLPNDAASPSARATAINWLARGPWNVGGRTRALAMDVSNPSVILAGSCSGGMWRSADEGQSWAPVVPTSQLKSVSGIAQDVRPGHTNNWYYITGEAYGSSASTNGAYYQGDGVYKSTDSGKTWSILPSTYNASSTTFNNWSDVTWDIVTDPSDLTHDNVYVAAYGGIYRSADGGATWTLVLGTFSSGDSYFTDVAISGSGVVYATLSSDGSQKGIYRSTDGINFTNITPAGFPANYNRVKIGISPSDESQVYFLGNTPGSGIPDTNYLGDVEWNSLWRYTYRSGNGSDTGGLWQDRSANLPSSGGMFDKFTCQGSYDLVVKVKPDDTNIVFIGGTNLYRSGSAFADNAHTAFIGGYQQGGALPVINDYINHHPDQHELVFFPGNPNKMLSGNDGGIFYTNDNTVPGVIWTPLNNGYITSMFYTCAIDHATTSNIIIGGAQDNGSWFTNSTNLSAPWVTPRGGDGSYCYIANNASAYYFSIQQGKMMRAKLDNSGNVDSFARIDPIGGRGYQFVNPFAIDPNNNNLMYLAAGKFLWRNSNLSGIPYAGNWDSIATNWQRITDSSLTRLLDTSITAVAVSSTPANRVYYGTNYKRLFRIDSANTGIHAYREITSSIFPGGANISCIAVDPTNADHVLVSFSNYNVYSIFYSTDGGSTWGKAGGNLCPAVNGPSIRWLNIIPVNGGFTYLAGTSVGLFMTNQLQDTSTVWVQQGANTIGNAIVEMIDYRPTDGLVVVATHSNGIYSGYLPGAASVRVQQPVTVSPDINLTNLPNPFSDATTFRFALDKSCRVRLTILDELGRPVQELADRQMDAGTQTMQWTGQGLPPGIYYCNLKAGDASTTRQVLKK